MIVKSLALHNTMTACLLAAGVLLVSGRGSLVRAQSTLNINDPSFETGLATIPYGTSINNQWQETFVNANAAGELPVIAGYFTDPVPDGTYVAWINNNYLGKYSIFQGLTNTLSAGTYTFNVWLGERQDLGSVGWSPSVGQFDILVAGDTFFANATSLTPTTFTNNVPGAGQWVLAAKTYTIAANDPNIGKQLVVELTNSQIGQYEANFDNLSLTYEPVPEPGSITLSLLGGAMSFVFFIRRRLNR